VAGPVGEDGRAGVDPQGLLQDGIGPVHVFEPMPGRRGGQKMGAHLRHEVRRHLDPPGRRGAGGVHPARHPADAGEIRHDEIAGPGLEGVHQGFGPVEVLADLQRHVERGRDGRVAAQVVVPDRLLQPGDALVLKRPPADERFRHREGLVVIDHEGDAVRDAAAHRAQDGEILREGGVAEPQLDALEPTLEEKPRPRARPRPGAMSPRPLLL
jgi:hypothetical protein